MGSDNSIRRVLNVLPPGILQSAPGPVSHSYNQPEFFGGNNFINFNVSFKTTLFEREMLFLGSHVECQVIGIDKAPAHFPSLRLGT